MERAANRSIKQGNDQQIIQGIRQDLGTWSVVPVGSGQLFTPEELAALYQSHSDAVSRILKAKAEWLAAISDFAALDQRVATVTRNLRNVVIGAFGEDEVILAHFGFAPTKKPQMTQEAKAAAIKKRVATRKARNTLGAKAKAKIKGTVPATPPLEVGAPAPAAASAATPVVPAAASEALVAESAQMTLHATSEGTAVPALDAPSLPLPVSAPPSGDAQVALAPAKGVDGEAAPTKVAGQASSA
jgi:hypothetical protein